MRRNAANVEQTAEEASWLAELMAGAPPEVQKQRESLWKGMSHEDRKSFYEEWKKTVPPNAQDQR
jgi:hypothetical protein